MAGDLLNWLRYERVRAEVEHASKAGKGRRHWLEGYLAALVEVEMVVKDNAGEDKICRALRRVRRLQKKEGCNGPQNP